MDDPLAFWRAVLEPPFLHDPPPSVLFGVKEKLEATIAMLGTLNADAQNEKDFGVAVASMATKYAIAILSHFEPLDKDGPTPVFLNLTMAQGALKNLLAVVQSQIDILHGDEEADAPQDARSPDSTLNNKMAVLALDNLGATARGHDEVSLRADPGQIEVDQETAVAEQNMGIDRSRQAKISIARWDNLGIGIKHDWTYYAFEPCPDTGARVKLGDGIIVRLEGKHWKAVLDTFAQTRDGQTARKSDLGMALGHYMKSDLQDAEDALDEKAVFDDGLVEKAKTVRDRLRGVMANLGRRLRNQIDTPDDTTVFDGTANNNFYQAAFVARHLIPDADGNYTFGEP